MNNLLFSIGTILIQTLNPVPTINEITHIPVAHAQVIEQPLEAPTVPDINRMENNCYLYIKSKIPTLKPTKDIKPNSVYPNLNGLTIINYDGVIHYMFNEEVKELGIWISECNYEAGKCGKRLLTWQYLKDRKAEFYRPDTMD